MSKEDIEMRRPDQLKQLLIHMRDLPYHLRENIHIYELCAQAMIESQQDSHPILTMLDMGTHNPFVTNGETNRMLRESVQKINQPKQDFHTRTALPCIFETLSKPCTDLQYLSILFSQVPNFKEENTQHLAQQLQEICGRYRQSISESAFQPEFCFFSEQQMQKRLTEKRWLQRNSSGTVLTILGLSILAFVLVVTIGGLASLGVTPIDAMTDFNVRVGVGQFGSLLAMSLLATGICRLASDKPSTRSYLKNRENQNSQSQKQQLALNSFWESMQELCPSITIHSTLGISDFVFDLNLSDIAMSTF